jgi:mannose-6-phosphate isomerase-like protein (cupin superfamily)
MRIEQANATVEKGWYLGPWNSKLPLSVGYAHMGVNEPHLHTRITEIYMIARGTAIMRVEQKTIHLSAGDIIVIEPGEAHTFLASSPDYFHFIVHTPGLAGEEALVEKSILSQTRLGLC